MISTPTIVGHGRNHEWMVISCELAPGRRNWANISTRTLQQVQEID